MIIKTHSVATKKISTNVILYLKNEYLALSPDVEKVGSVQSSWDFCFNLKKWVTKLILNCTI